ncbi:MAG: Asp23/Gls24 family envelope stress response protein [Defluviitaleaceae bacterium]|nr:Asp23/Gls24 family envelope stress response protein [Defluviitaleaceae bacterium]
MSQIVNEYGTIKIDREVVARVAGLAAMDCYGVVGMGAKSVKDGLVHLLKRESFTKGIHVSMVSNTTVIDIHIIVEYGTNIVAIAETLIKNVSYKVKEFVGLDVDQVVIYVVGIRL